MYFDTITTADDLKKRYRELAKTMHPDVGGHQHTFQAMQVEYENRLKELLDDSKSGKAFISKEEAMELGRMLSEFLKENRPGIWQMIRNVTSQPLANGLIKQFAPAYIVEYVRLLGLTD